MTPYPPFTQRDAPASGLRLPALQSVAQLLVLLAAAFVGASLRASAWAAAAVGSSGLLAAGLAVVYLRRLNRELHAAVRARAEWERRYYRLHESVAVGVFRADADGRLTAANRGLCALLGYRAETEFLAADFAHATYVGPGTYEAVLQRVRAQGALENLEMRLRRFDGLTVTVLATIQAIWDDAGEVTVFEGSVIDLTRERLAESQRRSMERRFRRLFDVQGVGMLVGNLRRGTLDEANPALIELWGLRPSELPVRFDTLVPDDQRPVQRSIRAELELHGAAGPVAAEYLRADGIRVPVWLSATVIEPQHGEFLAVAVARTAEADAQRSASQLQTCLAAALEHSLDPSAEFDATGRLRRANGALRTWLGVADAPLAGTLEELLAPCPEAVAAAAARASRGESSTLAVDLDRPAGTRRLDVTLLPEFAAAGGPVGFRAILADRTAGQVAREGAEPSPGDPPTDGDCLGGRRTA